MKTLVIIPVYNESKNIDTLITEIMSLGYDYLIINDKSTDNTKEIVENKKYNMLDLGINVGLAGVTQIGFKYASDNNYDCVVSIDGDGQHPPVYISLLINEINNGYDYVIGSRFVNKSKNYSMRMLGSRIICLLIKIKTGKTVTDPTSGMRVLGKKVLDDFSKSMNFNAEPDALCYCIKQKYKIKEVQVNMKERAEGKSYFSNPFKSIKYMIIEIVSIIFVQ